MLRSKASKAYFVFPWIAIVIGACEDPAIRPHRNHDGGGLSGDAGASLADADSDAISDADEGRGTNRDSDGDGTPDYLDEDSDNDGISDREEAGDEELRTPPRDTDGDTRPDYVDTDSDDNGIDDRDEVHGDVDADGIPNRADVDDDGDWLNDARELQGMPPVDTDGDGVPDYHDPDSDGDTILDGQDGDVDTDMDGVPNFRDDDSDNDSILDAIEAGDDVLTTPPVDTDMDGVPDFRDPDSDGDGLSDRDEVTVHGTSPLLSDSDGDGVSDLIETAAGTNPTDRNDSPRTRGDFVFTVPFNEPPDPARDTLSFRTSIQFADVYFLFDISGSMGGEISALRAAVTTIMGNLTCTDTGMACVGDGECATGDICSPFTMTCIEDPEVGACVPSMWTGAGYYENRLSHRLALQPDPAVTSAELARWRVSGGTESLFAALTRLANGGSADRCVSPLPADRVGCPAYRREAVRIAVVFTDENSDGGTLAEASRALMDAGITVIGVWSGSRSSPERNDLRDVVRESGSLDRMGNPLIFDGADAAVVPVVTTAITEVVQGVPLRVTIEATDDPDDAVDALQFIDRLETNTTAADCAVLTTEDTNADGFADAYPAVTPGARVCWDVIPRMNTTVMPTMAPQVFRARLTVHGDGSPLDSRAVYFLVPPRAAEIEIPE